MKPWQAGIVVIPSACNSGPYARSITVPGNVPYVSTVGAMTDNYKLAYTVFPQGAGRVNACDAL